ncbi:MAG: PAS domain S-box protein, partial [Solirubrobacteraceae bacterium]
MSPSASTDTHDPIRATPFLVAAIVAFATVLLPPAPNLTEVGIALTLFVGICGLSFAFAWARGPRHGGAALALLYLVVVALLRDGQGGANAGYAPMTLLPVMWLALYGRRLQLYAAIVGVALTFFVPLMLIGGDDYSPTELRRGILFTVTAAVFGRAVQTLVARLRERTRVAAEQRDLASAAEHASLAAATDARASELALRDSEERMRSLIDHLPDTVVLVLDRNLDCTMAEGQMLQRPEFEGRQFIGVNVLDGVAEDKVDALRAIYGAALAGAQQRFEYVSPTSGFHYETEVAPYREGGEIVGVMSISRDITARRRAEAEVAAAHERFVESFESAPIGMALVALDGSVTSANAALEELLGRPAGSLVGMKAEDVLENKDPAFVRERYARIAGLATGELKQFTADEVYVHADGHTIDVAVSISLVRDVDGRPSHCITQILDISERQRLQEQLQHLAERDPLTGLFNRREFGIALERHVAGVARGGQPGAAVLLDIDRVKTINDSYG